ncbi:MAG: hypothetical protein ACJ786_04645 [Catenulispora sp.]
MTDLVESEDELLDPQPAPEAAPRSKVAGVLRRWRARLPFGADSDPRQRRRAVVACSMALALLAGAGAAGAAVHRADLHRDRSREQSRILVHLLGGGASMTFDSADSGRAVVPDRFDTPLAATLTIGVRNDGAQPLNITAVQIKPQPGVDVESYKTNATVQPGEAVSVMARVAVHCTAADLPQYPSGVTVTVRTSGDKTKPAGKPTDLALAFDQGSHDSVLPDTDPVSRSMAGSFATNSFYHLCANVLALMPPQVTANVLPSGAGPRNPVVRYRLHIEGTSGVADIVAPAPPPSRIPGVSAETDLGAAKPVGASGLDVTVTDRITDCAAFGDYLASRGGATVAADSLHSAAPLSVEPADPRFRTAVVNGPIGRDEGLFLKFTDGGATVLGDLLAELTAACPQL